MHNLIYPYNTKKIKIIITSFISIDLIESISSVVVGADPMIAVMTAPPNEYKNVERARVADLLVLLRIGFINTKC